MAYGLNKVTLIGHLGSDPELRYTGNGIPVLNLTLATNESYKNQEGTVVKSVEWHNLVAYRKLAEVLAQYTRKGSYLYVEGKLKTRNWEDKTHPGIKHYKTEIELDTFVFLDSKGNGGGGPDTRSDAPRSDAAPEAPEEKADDLPF